MKIKNLVVLLSICMLFSCTAQKVQNPSLNIIPLPEKVSFTGGEFCLNEETFLQLAIAKEDVGSVMLLHTMVSEIAGYDLIMGSGFPTMIKFTLDTTLKLGSEEAYQLKITPQEIIISAGESVGLFYGVQTLGQMLTDPQFYDAESKSWRLPTVEITDKPSFSYRGLHLDVSRHFYSKEFVMKCLDIMAEYKLNKFHWHLTDAAGWRIEIKKYPELTERAAWRSEKDCMTWWKGDRKYATAETEGAYGGFYTQEEIREVVAYAAQRHITVIPEIEMPGHSEEVVSIYPHLGCYGEPYRNGEFCIGNEETFEFVENVLTEVMELFPSEFIHIGGDEASKAAWRKCAKCQRRIKREKLKDEEELQSYMISRVGKFLESKGRKLLGWDEILEGGLAKAATVMSWRGEAGGIKSAKMGHDVIMTPGSHCYFDSYQADPKTQPLAIGGFLPYLKVYSYHPVPAELNTEEAKHILGAQANLWTEYVPTAVHAEYMLFPRLLSLAEVVWTPREQKDAEDFKRRIAHHIEILKNKGVNVFTLSDRVDMLMEVDTINKQVKVVLESEKYQPEIRYTLDGSVPSSSSMIYKDTICMTDSASVSAALFVKDRSSETVSTERFDYHKGIGKKVNYTHMYSGSYPAAGMTTLTDGYRGGLTYGDGRWQGFLKHLDIVIDMEEVLDINSVSVKFMQLTGPGVYMPKYVSVSISENGDDFQEMGQIKNTIPNNKPDLFLKDFKISFKKTGRYIRVFAAKQSGFMFVDEVVIY